MLQFASLLPVLASGITIQIGNNVWNIGWNFIVFLIVAAVVGLVAEFIVGWKLPFGIVGAIILGIVGAWLMTNVIIISGFTDYNIPNNAQGVPIIHALIGAIVLVAIWHLLTYRSWHRRRRYYYRRS